MSTENRQKITSYLVTKHSWKGKYKRILEISDVCISTYNPQTLELTNQWPYKNICTMKSTPRVGSSPVEFSIHLNLKGKIDTMRFSSDFTTDILTRALVNSRQFLDPPPVRKKFAAYKYHWSQNKIPCILQLSESSLQQLDFDSNMLIAEYFFQNIIEICRVSDTPGAFYVSYSIYKRLHFFICDHIDELLRNLCHISLENLTVHMSVKNDVIFTLKYFLINRFGKFGSDVSITSLVEFQVYKFSSRYNQPSKRIFCLSEKCIVERDIGSYRIITLRPLESIHCLVKCAENGQNFVVEYITGEQRIYSCAERDNLLVSLLESVKSSGNVNAHVKSQITDRKLRILPFCNDLDEENESQIVKVLCFSATNLEQFRIGLERFNANIPYSGLMYSVTQEGLFTENKEKLIVACLSTVLDFDPMQNSTIWESIFLVLRRLFASKAGFQAFTAIPGLREKLGQKVVQSLKLNQEMVTYAALDCLNCLMQPMHNNYDLKFEQSNKTSLLSSPKFLEYLLDVFCDHVNHGTGALQITNMLDFLTFALCEPYSETTLGEQFDKVLDLVADRGRIFMKLFENSTNSIVKGAGLIMKSLIEESNPTVSRNLQEMALSEGAVLRHLRSALFIESSDLRFLTNRQLSRRLIGLWVAENPPTLDLLRQILPYGLINCLFSTENAPDTSNDDLLHVRDNLNMADQQFNQKADNLHKILENQLDQFLQHWRLKQDLNFLRNKNKNQKPITLRRRRQRVKVQVYNWKLFYYTFYNDFNRPDLIWNHKTRQELKEALDKEIRALDADKELAGTLPTAWNFLEYEVNYPSLINEIKIGDYYLRLLLEEDKSGVNPIPLADSKNFFLQIYHHFLLTNIVEMKCLCLKALTLVYTRCWHEIGFFADVKCIMMMLEQALDFGERDNLIAFLEALCANKDNVKEMIKYPNFKYLIDIACLVHLCPSTHKVRVPNQNNLIEASPDSQFGRDVQEWYFSNKNKERSGPYNFQEMKEFYQKEEINEKTKCWAQGMDQWRPMIHIGQFRWHLLATGNPPVSPPNDTTTTILNILIKICRFYPSRTTDGRIICPIPRIKSILGDNCVLPHLVQLFLTFDPIIVEKVATLLLLIVEDNVAVSRLYLTGAFYFILMYTGSNVLPIAKCLHYAHNKQAYRSEKANSILEESFLLGILPEATIFYLQNYGPEKYAQIFLGDFDTPEVIWNWGMRRELIEKLANHVADFSRLLPANCKAIYQFCPISSVIYEELRGELFCDLYYLRHLCDEQRFPLWPIAKPVIFLKACLETWMKQVEKKPENFSVQEACQTLEISPEDLERRENCLRRAYFKLAQQYHPDKNPEGRIMFEKINSAYEYLCSKEAENSNIGDQDRILLCLKAQCIVLDRYGEELKQYKYAGYYQLIKTIEMETEDENLFKKKVQLLDVCTKLCNLTVECSPLNAEQLGREGGLKTLKRAFDRCLPKIGIKSAQNSMETLVCCNTLQTFRTSSQFDQCLSQISQFSDDFYDELVYILEFKHLTVLCTVVCETATSLCRNVEAQCKLFKSGLLWRLLPVLFLYDFTLDESGVEKTAEQNKQEAVNRLALETLHSCGSLAGFYRNSPENAGISQFLAKFLTFYICKNMGKINDDQVLKLLNTNSETPYFLWNNVTRAEVQNYVEKRQSEKVDPEFEEFTFSSYENELIIGHVFIRIYNQQPAFKIEESESFCNEIFKYLHSNVKFVDSKAILGENTNLKSICQILEALFNVINSNSDLEIECIGHFRLIFALLTVDQATSKSLDEKSVIDFYTKILKLIVRSINNKQCLIDLASKNEVKSPPITSFLFSTSKFWTSPFENCQICDLTLTILSTLSSETKIVDELLTNGGGVHLLDLLCNYQQLTLEIREKSAQVLCKLTYDKLHGPRWSRLICKFLPPAFLDVMRDQPKACVQLFDSSAENPELTWNDEIRSKIQNGVKLIKNEIVDVQSKILDFQWVIPDDFKCLYENGDQFSADFIQICGVNLNLFVKNPSWVLRNPRKFASELIETILDDFEKLDKYDDKSDYRLKIMLSALIGLLENQPHLTEIMASQGYAGKLCDDLLNDDDGRKIGCQMEILNLLQQIFKNEFCVQNMCKSCKFLGNFRSILKRSLNSEFSSVEESICRCVRILFEKNAQNCPELIKQTLEFGFLEFLLEILGGKIFLQKSSKADLIKAIKSMARNVIFSDKISKILDSCQIWDEFKAQSHDLFLNDANLHTPAIRGGFAGYLTQGLSTNFRTPSTN